MRLSLSLSLSLSLLAAAPAAAQDDERPIVRKVREIQKDVERMRGLEFRAPVKVGVQKPEALQKMLLEDFEKEAPTEELKKQEKVIKAFGLVPESFQLRERLLDFLGEHIGGFYLPEKKELYLVDRSGGGGMNAMTQQMNDPMVMAHELQHALQDQHFGLDRWFDLLDEHEDRIQAYKSLTEGEAQLIGMSYMFGKGEREVDLKRLNRMQEMMMKMMPQEKKLPPYLQENMMFPYTQGAEFFQALKRKVGWEGISAAYADPPSSTEQILHPQKYFGQRDEPTELRLPKGGLQKVLGGDDAEELYENTLGEFNVSVLLRALGVGSGKAAKAAAGWDGDRFLGIESKDGRTVLVWLSTWDSEQEASEFAQVYRQALAKKRPQAHLVQRGTEVLLVHGAQAGEERDMLVRKGFRALKIVERWSPLPAVTEKPDGVDMAPDGAPPVASKPEVAEVTRPTTTAKASLYRHDEMGVTFKLPTGFAEARDPLKLSDRIPSAYFEGPGKANLRIAQVPIPLQGGAQAFGDALAETALDKVEWIERAEERINGIDGVKLVFKSTHRRDPKGAMGVSALHAIDVGGSTLAVLATLPADQAPAKAEAIAADALSTLMLDQAPTGYFEARSHGVPAREEVLDGEVFKLVVPVVLPRMLRSESPIMHSQGSAEGAKVQILHSDPTDLAGYASRLEAQIPLLAEDGKVHSSGIVKRRGRDVYQIEFELKGRRTHQLVVQAGGRLWTIACSAPSNVFDAHRWEFGQVFGKFRVQPGRKYRDQQQPAEKGAEPEKKPQRRAY